MERRSFIVGIGAGLSLPHFFAPERASANQLRQDGLDAVALRLSLPTPGRLGFYMDYSELDAPGTHRFYVCRTHGTAGAVMVNYATSGDSHETASGTLQWGDGEADIKSFSVRVPSKPGGTHRIVARLSKPTGGAALHFGVEHTVAYGVIDDGSFAARAVYFNADLSKNGNGTRENPYNNIHDAIANRGSATVIYGRGTVSVDASHKSSLFGQPVNAIAPPTGAGESGRVYIARWPGAGNFVIRGDGRLTTHGFLAAESDTGIGSWVTYRGIDFRNLGAGIRYVYNGATGVNVEYCSFESMDNGSNVSGFMPWGLDGSKVWRCRASNIRVNGDRSNNNAGGLVLTYDGRNISVQRSEIGNTAHGLFHKRISGSRTGKDVSINARFNHFRTCDVHFGAAATGGASHSFSVVQSNLFENDGSAGITHITLNTDNLGTQAGWWCNNIFVNCGSGETAAIHMQLANGAVIFGNIMYRCRKIWADTTNGAPDSDIQMADFNVSYQISLGSQRYEWRGKNYSTAGKLSRVSGHEVNARAGDPLFISPRNMNYRLRSGSLARGAGPAGSDAGIYVTGAEVIGPSDAVRAKAPAKMNPPNIANS